MKLKLMLMVCVAVLLWLFLGATVCFALASVKPTRFNGGRFYWGVNFGLDCKHFDYHENFANTVGTVRTIYESNDMSSCNASAGILFGYQKLYKKFGWSIEGRGVYSFGGSSSAWDCIPGAGGGVSIQNIFKVPYQFELIFRPMLILSCDSVAYIPIGVTCARLSAERNIYDYDQHVLVATVKKHSLMCGFAVGLGCEKKITDRVHCFAEYNMHFLGSAKAQTRLVTSAPATDGIYYFKSKQFENAVRGGIRIFIG
jgi:opacity protein-like surface antigen